MTFTFELDKPILRVAVILAAWLVCGGLGFLTLSHFIIGSLTDERVEVSRSALAAAADYFPDSSRLQARLSNVTLAATMEDDHQLAQAEAAASRAVNLSPWNFKLHLLLASAREVRGDITAAEESMRSALALAPHNTHLHWRLGNLLVRAGKADLALDEFRAALSADPSLLPAALDLLSNLSGGDLKMMETVVGSAPQARLALARFLLKQSRVPEAARIFVRIDRQARLSFSDSAAFLAGMIGAGQIELAYALWLDLHSSSEDRPLIWNGSFESGIAPGLAQFDWNLGRSDYARATIDNAVARTGARSLRLDFAGRDTTRLDGEIKQMILLRAGARYRLECYTKTASLSTPEGPRLAVINRASSALVAASEPVAESADSWQQLALEFTAPAGGEVLIITVQRKPRFSYDEPTRGAIWFDDFALTELKGNR
jgi:Tfp pilus assembly protein PilF